MMTKTRGFGSTFVLTQLAALLLLLSWLLPPTSVLWQSLDEAGFRALNGTLRHSASARRFWAGLNLRAIDIVPPVLLYILAVLSAGTMAYPQQMRFIHRGLALIAVMLVVSAAQGLFELTVFSYHRASPTLAMQGGVRLSEVLPGAKDYSPKSFPGDHGYVLISLAVFFVVAAPPRHGLVAVGIAALFSLPRLISGAHWLSDLLVGSVAKVLLCAGWLMATPLWDRLPQWIEQRLSRLPLNPVAWGCRLWWGDPQPSIPAAPPPAAEASIAAAPPATRRAA